MSSPSRRATTWRAARRCEPADLVDEVFLVQPAPVPDAWRDHWLLVAENGRRPSLSPRTADTVEDWLYLIRAGEGIDTAPAAVSRYFAWPGVAYVPLVDAAPCTLALVRRRDRDTALVAKLADLAVEIAAEAA